MSLFLCLTTICAQDSERRLIERLLRPNMDLQNHAQGKEFPAANSHLPKRAVTTSTFSIAPSRTERSFTGIRAIVPQQYGLPSLQTHNRNASIVQSHNVERPDRLPASPAGGLRQAHDANLEVASRTFGGQREFRERGNSQKLLDRQNPPLTIDQVRELLNKNK